MHAAGLVHYDFHAGNILLRVLPLDRVRMWVIDLHAVQCTTRPSLEMVTQNLAVLNQFFVGRGTRTDRLRFWTSYTAARSALGSHELAAAADETQAPALVRDMELSCQRAAVHMWRRADRHWARGNRHVLKLDTPHIRCRGVATLGSELLTEIRDAPDALFAERVEYWCKKSGTNRVAAVTLPIGGENRLCFWKLSQTRRIWPWLVCLVRGARVRAAWEIGHALLRRGIATPKPLAFVEARDGITLRQYLLTEGIPHSATVAKFLGDRFGRLAPHEQRQWLAAFLKRLAGQVRRLHSFGFDHRDLKASNILVCENPADSRLWLLDLDSVRRWTWLPPPRRVQNLARLNVSSRLRPMIRNSDRLRFLIAYLGTRRKAEWKSLWKKIARRSARKVLHNQRTGRPLT
jgi:tRNA A-37 threonylcarbamoyl transferase component Bud32